MRNNEPGERKDRRKDGEMRKKQLLQAVVFLAIFLIILTHLTYIIRTSGDLKARFAGFYAEPDNTIDAILIGSSPVYPYYAAPKIWADYGITTYPLSTNNQRPKAAKYLIQEAEKTQSPSLYIFEMRMYLASDEDLTQNMAFTRGVTDNMKYSWNRIQTINALVDDVSERYTYYFDIFKYHSNWKTIVMPSQLAAFRYENEHPLKGHFISNEVGPSEMADYSWVTERQPIPADQEEVLRDLLEYLKEHEMNALFIVSPNTMTYEKQAQYNYIADIIEPYGYNFLNFNDYYEEIGVDFATDFYDYGGHANAIGAEKYTAFLGKYLDENYEFEDKRGTSGYESWDESYERWSQELEEAKATIYERIENKDFKVIEEE